MKLYSSNNQKQRLPRMAHSRSFPVEREFILIKATSDRLTIHKIFCEDIIAFEAKGNYVKLYYLSGTLMSYIGIAEIAILFANDTRFIQLHRSFIIAIKHIKLIRRTQILMANDLGFLVGDNYLDDFKKLVSHHLIKTVKQVK